MDYIYVDSDENYDIKCGEVFFTLNGDITFYCTLCENKYEIYQEYVNHISEKHYPPDYMNDSDGADFSEDDSVLVLEDGENSSDFYNCSEEEISQLNAEVPSEEWFTEELEEESWKNISRVEDLPTEILMERPTATTDQVLNTDNKSDKRAKRVKEKNKDEIFYCTHCDFTCNDKSNMAGHIKRHSGHKPHKCNECPKAFFTNGDLRRHLATHTGERPFLCHDCGRSYSSNHKLALHFKRHQNIRDKQCPICGKSFFNTSLLNEHMTVHRDDRIYNCEFCKATFKRRRALASHKKLHENKREYQCKLCSASFNQNPGLHSHMKSKHSDVVFSITETDHS